MYLFDTDHLGFLQFPNSSEFQNLGVRLAQHSPDQFFISIVSFHEQVNGWKGWTRDMILKPYMAPCSGTVERTGAHHSGV